jgi:heptosyltransferase-2
MKILILALSGIGDALMFTPSLQLIKKYFPKAEVDALVMYKGVLDIYQRTGLLNKIIYFDFLKESKIKALSLVLSLRNNYDYSINVYPSNRKEYNVINFLINAKYRAGVSYNRKDFIEFGWLNNRRFQEDDNLHNVQENIKLCENLFNTNFNEEPELLFPLLKEDNEYADNYLISNSIQKEDLIIGFHPGCSTLKNHTNRRWESEKFAQLGKQLIDKYGAKIFIFGGREEAELKIEISERINSKLCIAVESDSLPHSAAIMKRCNVFITNDSSLMHIASALKLNVVAIIGPTSTNYIHPWKTNHKIATLNLECSPCFIYSPKPLTCTRKDVQFKCIKELTVDIVLDKTEEYLK